MCAHLCEFLFVFEKGEKVTKEKDENHGMKRLKERYVGLSSLSVSKRGIYKKCNHCNLYDIEQQ